VTNEPLAFEAPPPHDYLAARDVLRSE